MASHASGRKPAEPLRNEATPADAVSETDSDRHWMSLSATASAPRDLAVMGAAFQHLLLERDAIERKHAAIVPSAGPTAEHEIARNAALDPVSDRLHRLAHVIAALPAASPEQQRVKALAIVEFCEERSDDVVHILAASLAADLLRA